MDRELKLFDNLAFCWSHFEQDGLNNQMINQYFASIKSPLLVVGSGQGIVSKCFLSKGLDVDNIDRLKSMANLAKSRRQIKTMVIDFLEFSPKKKYKTVIVNTGVLSSSFVSSHCLSFTEKLNTCLAKNAIAILSFFKKNDFDIAAEIIGITHNSELLVKIWEGTQNGVSITKIVESLKYLNGSFYLASKFKNDLIEFETQIRDSGQTFKTLYPNKSVQKFIANSLNYISFGLDMQLQLRLFNSIENYDFEIQEIFENHKTVITLIKKIN